MKIYTAILATLLAAPAYADIPLVVAEACAKLETADQRVECLRSADHPQSNATSAATWSAVEREFTALNGAIQSGTLSHNSYQDTLLTVSKELAVFEQQSAVNPLAVKVLHESINAHRDALTFWGESIRFYSRRDNEISYSGGLPMKMVGLEWMIPKYQLPTQKSDIWGINQGVQRNVGLSAIWRTAKMMSDDGFAMLKR